MSYYFISIGGSGAKTLEALTHLCAAGTMPSRGELNILAVDPDSGNGNLERSSTTLNNFGAFQNFGVGNDTPLFKTKISIIEPFPWKPVEVDMTLDDLMGYHLQGNSPLGSLYEVLYTQKERATRLNEGFRGHPSIGAAVLAKKSIPREFLDKILGDANSGNEVKIFLAGSVFGGTGAAGIPTISRLLRNELSEKSDKVSIGGVLILPYFSFAAAQDNKDLFARSENFHTNTKAALKYYAQKDNVFNAMYFVGDSQRANVKNFSVGASSQCNDAHIVEFYSALAALDFFAQPITQTHEFKCISHSDSDNFSWVDFPTLTESVNEQKKDFELRKRFVQFARFIFAYVRFVKPVLKDLLDGKRSEYQYPWFVDYFSGAGIKNTDIKNFEDYAEAFVLWLKQLETLERREVSLIKSSMFAANPAQILHPDEFKSCDGSKTDLTLHEVWYRLSESVSFDSSVSGFGRFLRRLYDACKV